ncbi:MAG: hypothetical protein PHP52_10665, partial [Bacteroidales bacterium]|nr:hypothetical protein [Bacteroidales bacterium]
MFSTIRTYNTTTINCNYIQSLVASVNPQQKQTETHNSKYETRNPKQKNSRYYLGNYEKEITSEGTTEYYYISGPTGNIAVYISENGEAPELYYTITDHLGSIVAIADEDGEILEEQRYDPWGVYRNPATGEPEETPQHTMLYRGYTGHEMLPEFGLINMNGRLYDPVIARVLSPDNNVQNPNNPQNYNRYSYCYNNPLVYVDPDGDNPFLISMLFGIASGGYSGYQIGIAQGARGSELFGYTLMGGIIGGLSGFIGGGVGGAIAGANFPCASAVGAITGGAISGTISGGGFASLSGDNVGQGALYGAISGASGSFVSGAVGGAPGAFFGGATAGSVGTALRGGSPEERQRSAILGGIFGLCSYEISNYYNYKTSYSGELNYWGYHKANAAFARANFWEAEASW